MPEVNYPEAFANYRNRFQGDAWAGESLAKHTYYRIGGPAQLLVVPRGASDLAVISEFFRDTHAPLFFLGAGSNTLARDEGYAGVVVKTTKLNPELSADGELLRVGASVLVSSLLRRASLEGWGGLAFLTGIPGTLGGVTFMNGGTLLGELKDQVREVRSFDLRTGEWRSRREGELNFSYRKNHFLSPHELVFEVTLKIGITDPARVKSEIDELLKRRKETQPVDLPSCGSVFKNPKNSAIPSAWAVIERLGLRGHRIGGAQFSPKHCNFIVNLGGATCADVRGLIDLAKARAKSELGIELEEEVRYL